MTKAMRNFGNPEASFDDDPYFPKPKINRVTPSNTKNDQSEEIELVQKPTKSNSFKEWKT